MKKMVDLSNPAMHRFNEEDLVMVVVQIDSVS